VFHARNYRDAQYAANHGLKNLYLVPNGASEKEFAVAPDLAGFRRKHGIATDAFVVLTVGSLTGEKGHRELAQALTLLKTSKPVHVILNGNRVTQVQLHNKRQSQRISVIRKGFRALRKLAGICLRAVGLRPKLPETLDQFVKKINNGTYGQNKRALIVNLPRVELLRAFFDAQLFAFASNIECSPVVLYEAAAAGLPCLSVPVGNADEIVRWTKGGQICPAQQDEKGYTRTDPAVLAAKIDALIEDEAARMVLGAVLYVADFIRDV
jgi:glycosyltransferase involved in cell wall biosynthesis